MRNLIAFDEETFDMLKQLGRDSILIDLRDAFRKNVRLNGDADKPAAPPKARKAKSR